jgi:uncharacterized membrane protein YedE/YeeE
VTVDWTHFTPWWSLLGGLFIGLAATLLILFNGRVAGISGIVGGLLRAPSSDRAWRIAFVAGLVLAPVVYTALGHAPEIDIDATYPVLVAAGLLVGIGTRYGSGCTSGHGVCGISRMSPRSIVATVVFMGIGIATVYVVRHVLAG